jgi:hypothetical protein
MLLGCTIKVELDLGNAELSIIFVDEIGMAIV